MGSRPSCSFPNSPPSATIWGGGGASRDHWPLRGRESNVASAAEPHTRQASVADLRSPRPWCNANRSRKPGGSLMPDYDVIVVGAGNAAFAAAVSAREHGAQRVVALEKAPEAMRG